MPPLPKGFQESSILSGFSMGRARHNQNVGAESNNLTIRRLVDLL